MCLHNHEGADARILLHMESIWVRAMDEDNEVGTSIQGCDGNHLSFLVGGSVELLFVGSVQMRVWFPRCFCLAQAWGGEMGEV